MREVLEITHWHVSDAIGEPIRVEIDKDVLQDIMADANTRLAEKQKG